LVDLHVDLDDTWITYCARLKTQKTFKILRFLERSALHVSGSSWIFKWILVDLDVDIGGS
jgi:hypothetical protein